MSGGYAPPPNKIQLLIDVVMAGEEDWKERSVRLALEESCAILDQVEYLWNDDCNRYIMWVDDKEHAQRVLGVVKDHGLTVTRVMYGNADMTGGDEWKGA